MGTAATEVEGCASVKKWTENRDGKETKAVCGSGQHQCYPGSQGQERVSSVWTMWEFRGSATQTPSKHPKEAYPGQELDSQVCPLGQGRGCTLRTKY